MLLRQTNGTTAANIGLRITKTTTTTAQATRCVMSISIGSVTEHIAGAAFDASKWDESYVHTRSNFPAEDYFKNSQPVIYFDKDTDETNQDPFLGYDIDALRR